MSDDPFAQFFDKFEKKLDQLASALEQVPDKLHKLDTTIEQTKSKFQAASGDSSSEEKTTKPEPEHSDSDSA